MLYHRGIALAKFLLVKLLDMDVKTVTGYVVQRAYGYSILTLVIVFSHCIVAHIER